MRLPTRSLVLALPLALAACAAGGFHPSPADAVTLQLDYGGAEALMAALHRDSLADADVDSLLRVPGVRAMVSNITRFVPEVGDAQPFPRRDHSRPYAIEELDADGVLQVEADSRLPRSRRRSDRAGDVIHLRRVAQAGAG